MEAFERFVHRSMVAIQVRFSMNSEYSSDHLALVGLQPGSILGTLQMPDTWIPFATKLYFVWVLFRSTLEHWPLFRCPTHLGTLQIPLPPNCTYIGAPCRLP